MAEREDEIYWVEMPIAIKGRLATVRLDVRTLGFLNVAELKREPDWINYVKSALKSALRAKPKD